MAMNDEELKYTPNAARAVGDPLRAEGFDKYYAHTRAGSAPAEWDPLIEHCLRTARLAAEFCAAFAPQAGHLAGLWHDLGKYQPKFQQYLLRNAEAGHTESRRGHGPPHSIVGASHASQYGHDA